MAEEPEKSGLESEADDRRRGRIDAWGDVMDLCSLERDVIRAHLGDGGTLIYKPAGKSTTVVQFDDFAKTLQSVAATMKMSCDQVRLDTPKSVNEPAAETAAETHDVKTSKPKLADLDINIA